MRKHKESGRCSRKIRRVETLTCPYCSTKCNHTNELLRHYKSDSCKGRREKILRSRTEEDAKRWLKQQEPAPENSMILRKMVKKRRNDIKKEVHGQSDSETDNGDGDSSAEAAYDDVNDDANDDNWVDDDSYQQNQPDIQATYSSDDDAVLLQRSRENFSKPCAVRVTASDVGRVR